MVAGVTPRLLVRADAGPSIGAGHVMRCLALAQAWRARGGACRFRSCCESPALRARIAAAGCAFTPVERPHPDPRDLRAAAGDLLSRPAGEDRPWVLLDGYHFDAEYQQGLRRAGARLLVMDDTGHLPRYHAELLLNQNLHAETVPYRLDAGARALLGLRYLLLREEFRHRQPRARRPRGPARRLLVTLGGSDPDNATAGVLRALERAAPPGLEIRVVAGPASPHRGALAAALPAGARLLDSVDDMPRLMDWADAAVAAAGTTAWELAYMGVPAALVVLAENQAPVARALAARGAAVALGFPADLDRGAVGLLAAFLRDAPARRSLSRRARALVDGNGAARVVSAMLGESDG